ncbi:hypothetical protein ACQKWADRAFT_299819 [Trichoderma austrokoningii]
MAAPASEPNAPLEPGEVTSGPVRVLVQTSTSLVPGDHYAGKITSMRNLICQRFWNRDFDWDEERFYPYNATFGYENRRCYFLLNHGHSDIDPPILWYEWTGKSLKAKDGPLTSKIRSKVESYPFERPYGPRPEPMTYDNITHRKIIWSALQLDTEIFDDDKKFLRDHPEDAKWLKDKLETRLWQKIEPFCSLP